MKNAMISLTVVLGLLVVANNAAPIARRDDDADSCPATLRGPSGNAYFAFSTNLSVQTAREACASCYGGSLANVGAADLQFLGKNLESSSWIKAWNGDDYDSSCLTIQPKAGAQPGVGIDATCASQMWPLCTASAEHAEGIQRTQEEQEQTGETIITLAVPYIQKYAPAPEAIAVQDDATAVAALEPTKVDAEVNAVVPDATGPVDPTVTCPKKPDGTYQTDGSCIEPIEEAAAVVVVEEPTKVIDDSAKEQEVVPDSTTPAAPCVTCPGPDATPAEVVLEAPTKVVDEVNAALEVVPDSTSPAGPCVTCPGHGIEAAEVVTEEPSKVVAEVNPEVVVPDATHPIEPTVTCPRRPEDSIDTEGCIQSQEDAAAVVIEEPAKVDAEANNAAVPEVAPVIEAAASVAEAAAPITEATVPVVETVAPVVEAAAPVAEAAAPVVEAETPVVETETPVVEAETPIVEAAVPVIEAAVPVVEADAPVVEAAVPVVETVAPAAEVAPVTPTASAETVDSLATEKEKIQAAFEADTGACSSQLALGEQDPLVNEYVIATLSDTASCSEARQEALTADVQDRVAHYEAAHAQAQAVIQA
ncbi:hypothetical protein EC991_006875 [Linnemannia zychae]|nr:hypothetical protein EC991_006875 [Linnemannia zychae]